MPLKVIDRVLSPDTVHQGGWGPLVTGQVEEGCEGEDALWTPGEGVSGSFSYFHLFSDANSGFKPLKTVFGFVFYHFNCPKLHLISLCFSFPETCDSPDYETRVYSYLVVRGVHCALDTILENSSSCS